MTNRNDTRSSNRFPKGRVTHVLERFNLAITSVLSGLFVAAHLAKANVDVFDSVGLVFAMIRFGIIGFHLGNDIPPLPSRASLIGISDFELSSCVDVTELLRAAGAFLATVAALVSVYVVVFDEVLPAIWTIIVGLCWMFGVTMQIIVGIRVRMTLAPRETAECPLLARSGFANCQCRGLGIRGRISPHRPSRKAREVRLHLVEGE